MMRRKVSALVVVIPTLLWSASPIRAESVPTDSTEPATTAAEADSSEPAPAGSGDVETGQPSVAEAAPAEPGSGEGLTIGYISNLESVPIVHVISEGIREQAEIAGVNLLFCDSNGDNATALDCMRTVQRPGRPGGAQLPARCRSGAEHVRGRA